MSQGLDLLNEALLLARQEKTALEDGEFDQAIELAEKRGEITNMAWNMRETQDVSSWRQRLQELASLQKQLIALASRTQDLVRQRLNRSRMEKKRIQGYHAAVGHALQ